MATLASMTSGSAPEAREPDRSNDIGRRSAVRHAGPCSRQRQLLVLEELFQVSLLDDVPCADPLSLQPTRPDPAPDGLRVLAGAPRSFGYGQHSSGIPQLVVMPHCRARSLRAAASATFVIRAARVSGRRASATQPSSILRAEGGNAAKLTAAGGRASRAAARSSGTSSRSTAIEDLPRAVRLRPLDGGEARGSHPPLADQPLDARLVRRGPGAARLAWREVELAALVVDACQPVLSTQPKQRASSTAAS